MPTLTVDHSTPGEVIFTVAGTVSAGTVRYFKVTGKCEAIAWTTAFTFAGNETSTAISLDAGFYIFIAVDSSGFSSAYHAHVAGADDPLAYRCRSAVASFIRTMALPTIQDRVYETRTPIDSFVTYPCVFVHLWDFTERDTGGGTNARTEWEYPIRVLIGTRQNELNEDETREILTWRQTILEAFDWFQPADADIQWTRSSPKMALQRFIYPRTGSQDFEMTGSEIIVRCIVRRPRGFP